MMRKKLLTLFAAVVMLFTPLVFFVQPASALFENAKNEACQGVSLGGTTGGCGSGGSTLRRIISVVINILSILIGIIAVIMIIVGGAKYITASGDSGALESAKKTIVYALIGLLIVALAQFLVQFVLTKAAADPTQLPKCPAGENQLPGGGACRT